MSSVCAGHRSTAHGLRLPQGTKSSANITVYFFLHARYDTAQYLRAESNRDTIECRLLNVVLNATCEPRHLIAFQYIGSYLVPWASRALARECARNPRVLIRPVPHCDANTAFDSHAGRDDVLVVRLLLLEKCGRRWEGHTDIELGDGDLKAESSELLHDGLQAGGDLTDDEVALEANTVKRDAVRFERCHEVEQSGRLGASVLDVVLVDVELGVGVCRPRCLKANADV